jgi:hypothetical protein
VGDRLAPGTVPERPLRRAGGALDTEAGGSAGTLPDGSAGVDGLCGGLTLGTLGVVVVLVGSVTVGVLGVVVVGKVTVGRLGVVVPIGGVTVGRLIRPAAFRVPTLAPVAAPKRSQRTTDVTPTVRR